MDWRAKVELFEHIRLEYEFGVGTIQGVSRKLRVHRRLVREAIQSAIPARRKKTERPHVKMASAAEFIDAVLEGDRRAPRKQRHTAKRIWDRIREEVQGCTTAERTVRLYAVTMGHSATALRLVLRHSPQLNKTVEFLAVFFRPGQLAIETTAEPIPRENLSTRGRCREALNLEIMAIYGSQPGDSLPKKRRLTWFWHKFGASSPLRRPASN